MQPWRVFAEPVTTDVCWETLLIPRDIYICVRVTARSVLVQNCALYNNTVDFNKRDFFLPN